MKIFKRILIFLAVIILVPIIALLPLVITMDMDDKAGTEVVINENATNPYIREYLDVDVSAHRSGAGIAPQNTLMAFEKVLEEKETYGVDTYEFDVQLTKDGKLIILHDLTYDATSNAVEAFGHEDVYAKDLTFEEAQVLNMGENFELNGEYPYRGLRGDDIPYNLRVAECSTIIDYIEANSGDKVYNYIIEVKSEGEMGEQATDVLYQIITERNMQDRVIWASQINSVCDYMKETYPQMARSASIKEVLFFYLFARMDWDFEKLNATYCALQIPGASSKPINLGTKKIINYAHKNNLAVQYWTINEQADAEYLIRNGADCIMSDYPDMVLEAIQKVQSEKN